MTDGTLSSRAQNGTASASRRMLGPALMVLLGCAMYLPAINWGLPATVSWSQDTIATPRRMGAVQTWPEHWRGRYPPLHFLLLKAAFAPVYRHWQQTGACTVDPATGQIALTPPYAPKVGHLLLIARLISVAMAIGAGLGIAAATRRLAKDDTAAVLAGVTLMIGAAFTYFAHLGNVDVPSMFWFAWSVYFFVRLLTSRHWSDALLLGLLGALATATKDSVGGVYPGMALVLIVNEVRLERAARPLALAVARAVLQPRWLLGLIAFALPYLYLVGALHNFEAWQTRMAYWLDPPEASRHAQQLRYPNQALLLLATLRYGAGAVGWPMLCAMGAATLYCIRRHGWIAFVVLVPAISYYLVVLAPIHFVYSRFLFPLLALLGIAVGAAAADLAKRTHWPAQLRFGIPSLVLAMSVGYAMAINAEMLTDSRYDAENWIRANVEPPSSFGAFSDPQYLPRVHEMGYATFVVSMERASFERPQPQYLILSSYNYEDFENGKRACLQDLLGGRLGYRPVITFRGRLLGAGSSWLSLAGWGAPVPGKISPTVTILQRVDN